MLLLLLRLATQILFSRLLSHVQPVDQGQQVGQLPLGYLGKRKMFSDDEKF
jgi:hypothetical protein